ncbi:hypothetical protein PSTG_15936 [Puccinia striiformis f. sp. tritici PST-78]|uniref:Uncharacterized protein n=1 Tax=Puccinia striiformis f. sp. tritici PST-78 TaxID=1165861 RepID=A0A0L0UUA8_9BASI|nr:hypothetical protein PSTG_15936 [Puccinia striiformis f. sp. tritici PST-78]
MRLYELNSVIRLLEEMIGNYDVPREDSESAERDPNLTIDDMGEKAKIWERLESKPSTIDQRANLCSFNLTGPARQIVPKIRLGYPARRLADDSNLMRQILRSLGDFAYIFHHLSDPTPDLANLTINPVEQIELTVNNTNIQTGGDPSFRGPLIEMTRLTILFVKLTRIWVKKALKMIPKRPVLERDTQINSETMKRLRNAFDCITGTLIVLSQDHGAVHHRNRAISIALRDSIRISVLSLSQDMRSCLSDLNSHLVPSRPVGNTSIESDYEEWTLTLEQVWNKTVYQSLVLIPSLQTDPDQQLEQV